MTDPAIPDPELIERLLDDDLPTDEATALRARIDSSTAWRNALEQVRTNRELLARLHTLAQDDLPASPAPREIPTPTIPGYDLLHEIHRGGQGVVYAALQRSTGRRVALKLLLNAHLSTPIQRRRFEREIDLATSLNHPSIVRVFDRAEAPGGEPFYVMELLDAQPLDAYLREHDPPLRARLEIFRKVADAVSYAHQRAVMHRDLKPANILIDERREPHVLDFGLAKPVDLIATESLATDPGGFVGTLRYASPEQLGGDPSRIDVRTDVYSLTVILYEMLTGRLPYATDQRLSDLVTSISSGEPIRPRTLTPTLDPDLETILLKGLEKNPDRRYQSASELRTDVDRFLHREPITARPPTASYQLRKFAQRHKPLVAAGLVSLLILVVALVAVTAALVQTRRARDAAQRRFDQVHTLARTFIYDIHDDIADLPGATKARQRLVDVALQYLDSLAQDAGADRDLLLDLAKAYDRIGDVQGNPDYANLGDMPGALESYTKALDLRRRLANADASDLDAQRAVGFSHEHIGNISMYMGQSSRGVESFRLALRDFKSVAESARPPLRTEVLRDVGALQMKLGRALIVVGEDDRARQAIRESLETRRGLVAEAPDRQDLQRELSQSHLSLGDELSYAGDPDSALEHYRAAQKIRARLVELQQGNATAERDLGVVYNRIGNIHLDENRLDRARDAYARYYEISRTLADADLSNAEAQRDLSVSLEKMAQVNAASGRTDEAIDYYHRCIDVRERLSAQYPDNARFVQDLSIALELLGDAHKDAGRPREARTHYQRALEMRLPLAEQDPDNARLRRLVMEAHLRIAQSHADEADDESRAPDDRRISYAAARNSYHSALDLLHAMQTADQLPPTLTGLPDEIATEIERCTDAISVLDTP